MPWKKHAVERTTPSDLTSIYPGTVAALPSDDDDDDDDDDL
jgi:hypothetical protein